ncbi:MAG: hypothetical protein ACO30M_10410, partial [Candidatus Kapaibacteriota bacterium]
MNLLICAFLCIISFLPNLYSQSDVITVSSVQKQHSILVNGKDFFIKGMNWDYFPTGTNYSYSLWNQSDATIKAALDYEMGLLKHMGVNTIRQYTGIPAKWITYIYKEHGIFTILNHTFGRYGLTVNNAWIPNIDYGASDIQAILLREVTDMVKEYQNTPGLLLFLLGNENNYGLFWRGAETENIPMEDRESTKAAVHMYKLFNTAVVEMKKIDAKHPVAICNGDLLFLDIIAKECPDIDILGINVYRGISFDHLFERLKKEYGKPM